MGSGIKTHDAWDSTASQFHSSRDAPLRLPPRRQQPILRVEAQSNSLLVSPRDGPQWFERGIPHQYRVQTTQPWPSLSPDGRYIPGSRPVLGTCRPVLPCTSGHAPTGVAADAEDGEQCQKAVWPAEEKQSYTAGRKSQSDDDARRSQQLPAQLSSWEPPCNGLTQGGGNRVQLGSAEPDWPKRQAECVRPRDGCVTLGHQPAKKLRRSYSHSRFGLGDPSTTSRITKARPIKQPLRSSQSASDLRRTLVSLQQHQKRPRQLQRKTTQAPSHLFGNKHPGTMSDWDGFMASSISFSPVAMQN